MCGFPPEAGGTLPVDPPEVEVSLYLGDVYFVGWWGGWRVLGRIGLWTGLCGGVTGCGALLLVLWAVAVGWIGRDWLGGSCRCSLRGG